MTREEKTNKKIERSQQRSKKMVIETELVNAGPVVVTVHML